MLNICKHKYLKFNKVKVKDGKKSFKQEWKENI